MSVSLNADSTIIILDVTHPLGYVDDHPLFGPIRSVPDLSTATLLVDGVEECVHLTDELIDFLIAHAVNGKIFKNG
jgi:hypothetical protein